MPQRSRRRFLVIGLSAIALIAVVAIAWYLVIKGRYDNRGQSVARPPLTFDGGSDQLQHTVIVPTLDSPIPNGKSAIWCVSFQLAWNRLKNDVANEPIQLAGAQPSADQLNNSKHVEEDVEAGHIYAAAGRSKDGIANRIQKEMAVRFPDVPIRELNDSSEGAVAYAYLAATVQFDVPYFENDEPLLFTDMTRIQSSIGSFGIRSKDYSAYRRLRDQVQILYRGLHDEQTYQYSEFILDPCKSSQPYQIVLARVDRKATLADTLLDIERKLSAQPALDSYQASLKINDTLLVPNLGWRLSHHFIDLEGQDKRFSNAALQGLFLHQAMQTIEFRLDRSGADLRSESTLMAKAGPSDYHFNRPFLIVMKKRDRQRPFFVMWVDNAELLQRK